MQSRLLELVLQCVCVIMSWHRHGNAPDMFLGWTTTQLVHIHKLRAQQLKAQHAEIDHTNFGAVIVHLKLILELSGGFDSCTMLLTGRCCALGALAGLSTSA